MERRLPDSIYIRKDEHAQREEVLAARRAIFNQGFVVNSTKVDAILFKGSRVPVVVRYISYFWS